MKMKIHMKIITPAQLCSLTSLEREYNCDFYFPPFHHKVDCCFYDIDKLQNDSVKFREFLIKVKKVKVSHKFFDINGKKFMAVMR